MKFPIKSRLVQHLKIHDENVEKLDSEDPDTVIGTIVNALNIKWFVNPIFLLMVVSKSVTRSLALEN